MGNQQLGIRITEPHGIRFVEHRYAVVVSQSGRTKLIRHYVDPESVLFDLISSHRLRSKAMLNAEVATARNRGRLREFMAQHGAKPPDELEVIEEKEARPPDARQEKGKEALAPPELKAIDRHDLEAWASPAPDEAGVGELYDLLDLDALTKLFGSAADADAFSLMFRQQRIQALSSTEYDVVVSAWQEVKIDEVVLVMLSFGAQSTLGMFGAMLHDYQVALRESGALVMADTDLQGYASDWYGARYVRPLTDHWLVPRNAAAAPTEAFEELSTIAKAVASVRHDVLKEVSNVFWQAQQESDQRATVFLALAELSRYAVHESRPVASNDEWAFVPRHLLDKMDALLTTLAEATHVAEEQEASASHVDTERHQEESQEKDKDEEEDEEDDDDDEEEVL